MALKVIIPHGQTEITVNGLHQWDYGQQLEIEATDIPGMVEVHFACMGMQSAEVRTCSAVSGKLLVSVPDLCLEQSAPIIAWVYAINGNEGTTVKTITLPIIPRVKPQVDVSIPRDNTDAYTQFLTEVNNAVSSLKAGNVVVSKALTADHATEAAAMLVGDVKEAKITLDNLVTPGRYYCDYSVGTPTASYGYVDVFVRYANIMQVFYDFFKGDIYIRKKSGTDPWGEWTKGNANTATVLAPKINSGEAPAMTIYEPGIYVIDIFSDSENDNYYTAVIIVPDLARKAYSTIARDITRSVECQVVHYPQGRTETGSYWGILQLEHNADYAYEYVIKKCVRIADI